jgi:membrane associated rhomboid family serine protease
LGHGFYLFFYLLGGLLATAGHWLQDPNSVVPVIGASGAVAAILGAYAVTYPHARVHTLVFLFIFITFWELPALFVRSGTPYGSRCSRKRRRRISNCAAPSNVWPS